MVRRTPIGSSLHALAALLTLVAAALAPAQTIDPPTPPEAKARSDRVTLVADIGFVGKSVALRWTPILVRLDPGAKARSGTIVVEHVQDRSQIARIATPFAAVPGVPCVVPLLTVLPEDVQAITITALDERQRPLATTTYSTNQSDAAAAMTAPQGDDVALILAPGMSSFPDAARAWFDFAARVSANLAQGSFDDTRSLITRTAGVRWSSVLPARIVIEDLPTIARGYDGLMAVVMPDDIVHKTDPRAIDAMHEWVRQGGQLIILAGPSGQQWTRLLPPELAGIVTLNDATTRQPGTSLQALLTEASRPQSPTPAAAPVFPPPPLQPESQPAPPPQSEPAPAEPTAEPASSFIARGIVLGPGAPRLAWSADAVWADAAGTPLVARGPVGLGMVTILAIDPARLWTRSTPLATGVLWQTVLQPQLTSWNTMVQNATYAGQLNWTYRVSRPGVIATNVAIENVVRIPGIGSGYLIILGSAMLALTLLVGPIDRRLLRWLGLSQYHWLSALVWVGLAGVIAYVLPRAVRTEPTRLQRVAVVDTIPAPLPSARPGPAPHTAHAAITSIYASAAGSYPITSRDPGAWFHGVGPVELAWGEVQARPNAVFPTIQRTEQGPDGTPAQRASRPDPVPTGVWTLRCFADQSASPTSPIRASIDRTTSGYQVLIDGLHEQARLTHAALQTRAAWYDLRTADPQSQGVGAREGAIVTLDFPSALAGATPDHWAPLHPTASDHPWSRRPRQSERWITRPGQMLSLPGPDRRQAALDMYLESGYFAILHLCTQGGPPDVDTPGARAEQTTIVRVLLTLPEIAETPSLIGPPIPGPARRTP